MERIISKFKRFKLLFVAVFALVLAGAGYFMTAQAANPCDADKTNIIYCGLSTSDAAGLKSAYNSGKDSLGRNDVRKVMQWGGFTDANIASANNSNVKVGNLTRDGKINVGGHAANGKVSGGTVVGTGTQVTTRYNGGGKRPQVLPGVYTRSASENQYMVEKVLVLFDNNGKAVAALIIRCGNVLKFTPTPPPAPQKNPSLVCNSLTATPVPNRELTYNFTAKASVKDTDITSYVFNFGDGKNATVATGAGTATATHAYAKYGTKYTANVVVNSKDKKNVTSTNCRVTITTPAAKEPKVQVTKKVIDGDNRLDSATVGVNTEFSYEIIVKNTGNVDLKDVVVTDTPAAGVTLLDNQAVGTVSNNTWKTTIGSLAVGQSETFTLKAKVPTYQAGNIKNTVCVDTPTIPGGPDDCDDADVNVPKPGEEIVCRLEDKKYPHTIKEGEFDSTLYSRNPADCQEVPVTEIPSTGPTETLVATLGLGTLTGAGYYWYGSRRKVISSLLQ